jgi:leucyl-tRNA synthetase
MYEIVFGGDILNDSWPKYDEKYLVEDEVEVPIQVNGKLRGKILVSRTASEDEIKEKALVEVKDYVASGVKKIIYIPGRIFNIVV